MRAGRRRAGKLCRSLYLIRRRLFRLLRREVAWLWGRWRRSLQFRTVASTLLVTFVAMWDVGIFLSNQIATGIFQEQVQQAQVTSSQVISRVRGTFDAAKVSDKTSLLGLAKSALMGINEGDRADQLSYIMAPIEGQSNPLSLSSLATYGVTLATVPGELKGAVRADQAGQLLWKSAVMASGSSTRPVIVVGTRMVILDTAYELYLIYDLTRTQDTLNRIQSILWISGAGLIALIGGIIWYVTRNVVQPVYEAARVAQQLAAGQLQERMHVQGEDEVARLGVSFNRMASALQDQITQLAALSQMQQKFVSDVSHELRTPLTTVRMAAQLLYDAREDFEPGVQRSAVLLHDQVERFQALLADLLEISRFDAGAAVLTAEPEDLLTIVQEAIEGCQLLAEQLGSRMHLHSTVSDEHALVEVDQRRISRIVRNLLINALEHGEGGPIDVYVAADDQTAALAVRDYGVGLSPEERERVFDRFWRADPARTRTTGGSGLGLSIAAEDARLHNGRLEVWGLRGQGACFRLLLPRTQRSHIESVPLDLPPGGEARGALNPVASLTELSASSEVADAELTREPHAPGEGPGMQGLEGRWQ